MPEKDNQDDADSGDKSLDEKKAEALNLWEKEEKKSERKGKGEALGLDKASSQLTEEGEAKPQDTEAADDHGSDSSLEEVGGQKIIHIKPPIIVKDLAEMMEMKPFKIIQDLMELDVFANQTQSIEPDVASQICEKHGFVFEKEKREKGAGVHKVEEVIEVPEVEDIKEVEEEKLAIRPPVVTFMGHVDHGKTSLLDAYRGSRVVNGEAGGITQHIGAYQIIRNDKSVTFIDTPGHAAFSEMRARGADITDIVVLVVAADDGLMPTTFEAIDHCRAAGVTIIIAINKVDLPRADVNKVKGQLQENDLTPEDWGGETICVEVSAKEGTGLDELLEIIHLQAEVLELKSNPEGAARGIVIEARTEPGKGPTATVVVQAGTLDVGDAFICGNHHGKVKALIDDTGVRTQGAGPSSPIEVVGYSGVPNVGDELIEMESERKAKKLGGERLDQVRQEKLKPQDKSALETLFANIEQGKKTTLKLIIKADVQGSIQAIEKSLIEIESDKISVDILRQSAGPITEADVLLASASDAILIGFNTKVESKAQPVVKREGVQVKLFSIIYELIDQVKEAMLGLLDPETRERVIGHAKVLEVFKLSSGRVGGCVVTDGKVVRTARARVVRDGVPIYDGGFSTLRRFKDDAKEVKNGLECGIKLGKFNDYQKEDVIECYELEKLAKTL
ncbi:MAG: translation initiation factor IF-2 [Verrucomicrobiales bacterium]|nr:translation initiation factor IF-2 [Verrucomicrobiales bacterium]|tara:strand:+ start:78770 stop:80797 length:2028 start_codon:yes stop_codon:yes gene_type:complete